MSTVITFDVTEFRLQFPEFADPIAYPDARLQGYWDRATCYIGAEDYGNLSGNCRRNALNLMTAHLATLSNIILAQETPGMATAATIEKISVTLTPPPEVSQWQWWLNLTGYGQQLLALLQVVAVGGFQSGALPETAAFRRVGGIFI